MQVVPSRAKVALVAFQAARRAQHEAMKVEVAKYSFGQNVGHLVLPLPANDAVTCGACELPVPGPEVFLVCWGAHHVCEQCFEVHAAAPILYREVLRDGTLGGPVTIH